MSLEQCIQRILEHSNVCSMVSLSLHSHKILKQVAPSWGITLHGSSWQNKQSGGVGSRMPDSKRNDLLAEDSRQEHVWIQRSHHRPYQNWGCGERPLMPEAHHSPVTQVRSRNWSDFRKAMTTMEKGWPTSFGKNRQNNASPLCNQSTSARLSCHAVSKLVTWNWYRLSLDYG